MKKQRLYFAARPVLFAFGCFYKRAYNDFKTKLWRGSMPAFLKHQRDGMIIGVCPSDTLRNLPLLSGIPYFNSTNIKFGLQISTLKSKAFKDVDYEWRLYSRENNKLIKSGQDTMQLSNVKVSRFNMRKNRDIDYMWQGKYITFTKFDAIKIGHLSKFEAYDLRINLRSIAISSEDMTVSEFTLKDIDDVGMELVNILLASGFGIVAGFIGALITILIFGGI